MEMFDKHPDSLQGTGGPKNIENLYMRLLQVAFRSFRDMTITEEKRDMHEGRPMTAECLPS